MKSLWLWILSMAILFGVAACGTGEDTTAPDVTTEAPETTAPTGNTMPSRVEEYLREHDWYLVQKPWNLPDPIPLTDMEKAYAVKVPKTYSQTVEEFDIAVDFFRDAWVLGDFMQVSIAVRTRADKRFYFRSDSYGTGMFERSDGEQLKLLPCKSSDSKFATDVVNVGSIYPNAEKIMPFERVYVTDPAFFVPDSEYTYVFRFTLHEVTWHYEDEVDRTREPRVITVEIPVTVETIQ